MAIISFNCKHSKCEDCELFGCKHSCHTALEDSGSEIEESYNGFSDDEEDADGIELNEVE